MKNFTCSTYQVILFAIGGAKSSAQEPLKDESSRTEHVLGQCTGLMEFAEETATKAATPEGHQRTRVRTAPLVAHSLTR
ncbi:hypothetical protein Sru01_67420 [Sphaerisporangium rufum]|uniref:Uncharacterized protein n=1 Tax=Sphaerisporangium rufum TaxID=1381558 RepID=A0A919RBM8_9ACTN|nr:hypothetical protein Sru01_67420 [Sphaerisporangium rufum]